MEDDNKMEDEPMESVRKLVMETCRNRINELQALWTELFNEEMVKSNLLKLNMHVKDFYGDILNESVEKKLWITNEIEEIKKKMQALHTELNIEKDLPVFPENIPLLVMQIELDKQLDNLIGLKQERHREVIQLILEQNCLVDELNVDPIPLLADPLPNDKEIANFKKHLNDLHLERMNRMNQVSTMRAEIKEYLNILTITPLTDAENRLIFSPYPNLSGDAMRKIGHIHARYANQVMDLKLNLNKLRAKLRKLIEQMPHVADTIDQKLLNSDDVKQCIYDVLFSELQRLEKIRCEHMKQIIDNVRAQIVEYWDKNMYSEKRRKQFTHYYNDYYSEDLLRLHEVELDELKSFYKNHFDIFELIQKRKSLWEQMSKIEVEAKAPGRYNNRGGNLLKEERERKQIANKLPRIEAKIKKLVKDYETRELKPFEVYDQNILTLMEDEWKQLGEAKQLSSARKQVRSSNTPRNLKLQLMRTPLSSALPQTSSARKITTSDRGVRTINSIATSSNKQRKLINKNNSQVMTKRSLVKVFSTPKRVSTRTITATNIANNPRAGTPVASAPIACSSSKVAAMRSVTRARRYSFKRNIDESGHIWKLKKPEVRITAPSSDSVDTDNDNANDKNGTSKPAGAANNNNNTFNDKFIELINVPLELTQDTYASFEKFIEPRSRSSALLGSPVPTLYETTNYSGIGTNTAATTTNEGRQIYDQQLNEPDPLLMPTPDKLHQQGVANRTRAALTKSLLSPDEAPQIEH